MMKNGTKRGSAALFSVVVPTLVGGPPAGAQDGEEAPKPPPCSSTEYRQFDFWIGHWQVTGPKGGVVGTNRIERIQNGCGFQENWEGKGGVIGTSLNIYNAEDGLWHQTWIDNTGSLLQLKGGLANGAMVMTGVTKSTAGAGGVTLQKITWTPNADGTVRQYWESSEDDGKTWSVAFDGLYTKVE